MSGQLLGNLLLFGRLLRRLGLDVDPGRTMDLMSALGHVELGRKADFYHATRSLLVRRREEIALFDAAFEAFWRRPSEGWTTLDLRAMGERRRVHSSTPHPIPPHVGGGESIDSDPLAPHPIPPHVGGGESPHRDRTVFTPRPLGALPDRGSRDEGRLPAPEGTPLLHATLTYSAREVLRHKDFAELSGDELKEVRRAIASLAWKPGERRTRRRRPGSGPLPDLRRTLRRNLRYGGEILDWARREPKRKARPLVALADVSGSMERYTRLLLLFFYSLAEGIERPVEAFVFGTRLTRITRELRGYDVDRALGEIARAVPDWSGGTRIGEALRSFNFEWGRRVLGRGAVVLLISDGWDRGDAEVLREEMGRLQRSCHRLIWLNPLLGSPEYEPLARGMKTALPYVDDFLPVHNLASLEELAALVGGIDERRPERAQRVRPGFAGGPPPTWGETGWGVDR